MRTLTLTALALAALVLGGCGDQGERERTDAFIVGPRPTVVIESFGGEIEVRAGEAEVVRVDSTLRNAHRIDFTAEQRGGEVVVRARLATRFSIGNLQTGAAMVVTVPATADVDVTTSDGAIRLSGVDGRTTLKTSNGSVTVSEASGTLDVTTSNGQVRLVAFTGAATVDTSNGSITATVATGAFDLTTSNGGIGFDGWLSPGGMNAFRTGNGSVDVEILEPDVHLDLAATGGVATAPTLDNVTVSRQDALAGDLGGSSASLVVRTANGSISIR